MVPPAELVHPHVLDPAHRGAALLDKVHSPRHAHDRALGSPRYIIVIAVVHGRDYVMAFADLLPGPVQGRGSCAGWVFHFAHTYRAKRARVGITSAASVVPESATMVTVSRPRSSSGSMAARHDATAPRPSPYLIMA